MSMKENVYDREYDNFEENSGDQGTDRRVNVKNTSADPIPVTTTGATVPKIIEVTAVNSLTEYFAQLSNGTRSFSLKVEGNSRYEVYFSSGAIVTWKMGKYSIFHEEGLQLSNDFKIYFKTEKANIKVKILEWT